MSSVLYGIPTCGTCKKAKAWLEQQNIAYSWIDLRKTPPNRDQVQQWVEHAGNKAMRNTAGRSYRQLGEEKHVWNDAEWIDAFVHDPMLLKRPIFELEGAFFAVGFQEKTWQEIYQNKMNL